jgi:hypothetical protein
MKWDTWDWKENISYLEKKIIKWDNKFINKFSSTLKLIILPSGVVFWIKFTFFWIRYKLII